MISNKEALRIEKSSCWVHVLKFVSRQSRADEVQWLGRVNAIKLECKAMRDDVISALRDVETAQTRMQEDLDRLKDSRAHDTRASRIDT